MGPIRRVYDRGLERDDCYSDSYGSGGFRVGCAYTALGVSAYTRYC
jgi:hypothetical protein